MASDPTNLGIGDAARLAGVTVEAVRYYEAEGLLAPPRDASGRRTYRQVDVDALGVITALRAAGFGIREIGEVMDVKRAEDPPLARLDAGLSALDRLDASLDERQAALDRARELVAGWRADLAGARASLVGAAAPGASRDVAAAAREGASSVGSDRD